MKVIIEINDKLLAIVAVAAAKEGISRKKKIENIISKGIAELINKKGGNNEN